MNLIFVKNIFLLDYYTYCPMNRNHNYMGQYIYKYTIMYLFHFPFQFQYIQNYSCQKKFFKITKIEINH